MAAHSVGLQDAVSSPAFHGVLSTSENSCVLAKQEKCRLPQVSLSLSHAYCYSLTRPGKTTNLVAQKLLDNV